MRWKTAGTLGLVLVMLAGCAALSPTGAPLLTLTNEDDREYQLSVYVLSNVDDRDGVRFRATDEDGERRTYDASQVRGGAPYRNVTVDAADDVHRMAVPPARTTSAAINIWSPGDATVYVIETADGEASLVGVHVITCGNREQEHGIAIANGTIADRSVTCP